MHPTCRSAILRSKAASRCTHECHTPRSRSRMRRLGGGQSMKPSRRRRRSPRLTNTSPPSVLPAVSSRPNARIAAMAVTRGPPAASYGAAACHRARMPRARRGRRRLWACRGTWPASARRRHSSRRRGRRCRHPTRRAWSGLRRGGRSPSRWRRRLARSQRPMLDEPGVLLVVSDASAHSDGCGGWAHTSARPTARR